MLPGTTGFAAYSPGLQPFWSISGRDVVDDEPVRGSEYLSAANVWTIGSWNGDRFCRKNGALYLPLAPGGLGKRPWSIVGRGPSCDRLITGLAYARGAGFRAGKALWENLKNRCNERRQWCWRFGRNARNIWPGCCAGLTPSPSGKIIALPCLPDGCQLTTGINNEKILLLSEVEILARPPAKTQVLLCREGMRSRILPSWARDYVVHVNHIGRYLAKSGS